MSNEKIEQEVTKLVDEILQTKSIAGIEKEVEEALKKAEQTITLLTDKLSALEKSVSDNATALEALESNKNEISTELAAKVEELSTYVEANKQLQERAEKAEAELENLKKDIRQKDRMAELDALKVSRVGASRDKQVAAVRDMSDEDFAAYKEEMVALRAEFLSNASLPTEAPAESESASLEGASAPVEEVLENKEPEVTPPADVNSALETASTTIPNAETASVDKWVEYRTKFEKAMNAYMEAIRKENEKEVS
jgi:chromosome segregation ATPase